MRIHTHTHTRSQTRRMRVCVGEVSESGQCAFRGRRARHVSVCVCVVHRTPHKHSIHTRSSVGIIKFHAHIQTHPPNTSLLAARANKQTHTNTHGRSVCFECVYSYTNTLSIRARAIRNCTYTYSCTHTTHICLNAYSIK